MANQPKSADALELGVVVKPHGVRGEVKVRLHNPASQLLQDPLIEPWLEADGERLEVKRRRTGAGPAMIVLELAGVCDRARAEVLRGARLLVGREAVELEDDEYLYADLIGCEVFAGDEVIGRVADVFEAGASDVLVVKRPAGPEMLLPVVDDWVESIEPRRRRIVVVEDAEQRWRDA